MFDYKKLAGSKEQAMEVVKYWEQMPRRAGDIVPRWCDFELADIAPISNFVFISEWCSDRDVRVRHSGESLTQILTQDITGVNLFDLLPPGGQRAERAYYGHMVRRPCAGEMARVGHNKKVPPFVYRNFHLPLLDDHGMVKFFIGVGGDWRAPSSDHRLALSELSNMALLGYRFVDIGAGVPTPSVVHEVSADWVLQDTVPAFSTDAAW